MGLFIVTGYGKWWGKDFTGVQKLGGFKAE
jgi:hypothetical protein